MPLRYTAKFHRRIKTAKLKNKLAVDDFLAVLDTIFLDFKPNHKPISNKHQLIQPHRYE